MHDSWKQFLAEEQAKQYFLNLKSFLKDERTKHIVFPNISDTYNALSVSFEDVKVVILGQDPYHGPNQAHGISFSVQKGCDIPPSLKNIYKELETDIPEFKVPKHGNLSSWTKQGVLMLNAILTVRQGEPGSHRGKGWETFTKKIISLLSDRGSCVFVLWGSFAQEHAGQIDNIRNYLIKSVHPSPLSAYRGFFGSRPFSAINNKLSSWNVKPIDWNIPD